MAKNTDVDLSAVNLISKTTEITGNIKTDSDIRIDGKHIGNIITKGRLIIGKTGEVEGDVVCKNAEIEGKLSGKIQVAELLTLLASSFYEGEITTSKLMIEPGAIFSGSCKMNESKK